MDTEHVCSTCGKALEANAPGGLCPECLIKVGLGSGVDPGADTETGATRRDFVPPRVEKLGPLFPQLEILELIGKGGMGAVYKARQRELDRIVALKILPPDVGQDAAFAERFTREARALAKLNHPGIVTIYDFGRADGLYFFLMEYVDGVSLQQLLHGGRVSAREALAIVPQICDALQYAHDQGIVHRDIKPGNILLDRRGRVKVADFGLAKIIGNQSEEKPSGGESAPVSSALSDASKVMGTPQYMSPEQISAPGEVDHRADIYALGVVFYQMLTGELPGKPIEPPSKKVSIDVRLDEVVLRSLKKEPARRYQQVGEFKTQLETIAATAQGGSEGPKPPARQDPWRQLASLLGLQSATDAKVLGATLKFMGFIWFPVNMVMLALINTPAMWPKWTARIAYLAYAFNIATIVGVVGNAIIARRKGGSSSATQRRFVVVGRRGGKAAVNWPGVLLCSVIALTVGETVTAVASLILVNRIVALPLFTVFCSVLATIAAIVISEKLATPLDKLALLDEPAAAVAGVPPVIAQKPPPSGFSAAKVPWRIWVVVAVLFGSIAGAFLVLSLLFYWQRTGLLETSAEATEIESVVVGKDWDYWERVLIKAHGSVIPGLSILVGTNSDFWLDHHTYAPYQINCTTYPGHKFAWTIKFIVHNIIYMEGDHHPVTGEIVLREGTLAPEPDGSYIIGEFKPDNGVPLPIAVGLEKGLDPSVRAPQTVIGAPASEARLRQIQAAQVELPHAEAELARLTKLHSSHVITDQDFSEATYKVEELQAESRGDDAEVLRIRLRQAEAKLARAKDLLGRSSIGQEDYEQAKLKVELLRAQLAPVPVPSQSTNREREHQ